MHFTILSIFPEFFQGPLDCGLLGRARNEGLVSFDLVNPRDYTTDRHRSVDDRPYGGGPGMVMALPPLVRALESLEQPGRLLLLSPRGKPLTQGKAASLAAEERVTLICGRYEGIDARLEELVPVEPVSVGDFVLNGGEAAAVCLIEAVARLRPGFMGHASSPDEESFAGGLLEYPHYTRPEVFRGKEVPEVLLSGDHARIAAWRRQQALHTTLCRRPDLLAETPLSREERTFLAGVARVRPGRNLFVALVHGPVKTRHEESTAVSLTNLDIHDIARVSHSYGMGGVALVTPLKDQQQLAERLMAHWRSGPGCRANPDRAQALQDVWVADDVAAVMKEIERRCGVTPTVLVTSAATGGSMGFSPVRKKLATGPVLLLLGTGAGLADEVTRLAHGSLPPIRPFGRYNHLSVRSAAAILIDRLLGDAL